MWERGRRRDEKKRELREQEERDGGNLAETSEPTGGTNE